MKLYTSGSTLFILYVYISAVLVFTVAPACSAQQKKISSVAPPLIFEQNTGQAPTTYKFLARESNGTALFSDTGMEIVVSQRKHSTTGVKIQWTNGEQTAGPIGEEKLPGHTNYLIGNDPTRWTTKVPQFSAVRYDQIYKGIDLVFHAAGQRIEQDFIVAPWAEPSEIVLRLDRHSRLTNNGDLELKVAGSAIRLSKPFAYQTLDGSKVPVKAEFAIQRGSIVTFRVGKYDHSRPLLIDPVFVFSTFLAGTKSDQVAAVTTATNGNIYVAGSTNSIDFPMTNAEQPTCASCTDNLQDPDAYVSELDPTGHTLLYSTYIGGSSADHASTVNVDANGNIIISGVSSSSNFPHAGSLPIISCASNLGCFFIVSLSPNGSTFNYAGLVGGGNGIFQSDGGKVAVDSAGNAYLTGVTSDSAFQLTSGTLGPTLPSPVGVTMFVLKVGPSGGLLYSTAIIGNAPESPGGPNNTFVPAGISVDSNGDVTAGGQASPGLPTTAGVLQTTFPGGSDTINPTAGFVLQLNSTATALNYATYIPGTDTISAFAVDSAGNSYVTGSTNETNLPITPSAYQKTFATNPQCSCSAGFIVKLDDQGKSVLAATYLAGTPVYFGTSFTGIAVDGNSNVIVGGETSSADFPLKNPFLPSLVYGGGLAKGLILAEMNSDLSQLLFGTYLSGSSATEGSIFASVAVDAQNRVIVAGATAGNDFPTTPNSFEPQLPEAPIAYARPFISKLDLSVPAPTACLSTTSITFGTVTAGTTSSHDLVVTNCGNAPLNISSLVASVATMTASQSCGPIASGSSCTIAVLFSPVDGSASSGTLTLTDDAQIPQNVISVSGVGGVPKVTYPPLFSFGDLLVGTQHSYKFGLQNGGTANWVISSISVAGDFSTQNTCTTPIPPPPSSPSQPPPPSPTVCTIMITFAPTQAGTRTGTLTITDNVAGSPHMIQLSGNGLTSYPAPTITAMIAVDDARPLLQIGGTNFFPESQVLVNGSPRAIQFQSEHYILANLTASDVAEIGELSIAVMNPTPGGGVSSTATATVYGALRNISIIDSLYDPNSNLIYATVYTASENYAGQIVAIDPAAGKVVNSWNVGNGPQQLAISDDGKLLYVGLNGDKRVAQVSLPSGTVNFAVGLGNDPLFGNPMLADAIRVLPGQPHAWAVTLCGAEYTPCGAGVAVFDGAVQRPNIGGGNQTQPDSLLFIGNDATDLFGTTFNQGPSSLYKFTISANGAALAQTVTNFAGPSPGGAALQTDGTSIFAANGQVIDQSTMEITSNFPNIAAGAALALGTAEKRAYFAGVKQTLTPPISPPALGSTLVIGAFDLQSEQLLSSLNIAENGTRMYRWGANGLVLVGATNTIFLRTSLTGNATPAVAVNGTKAASVSVGLPAVYNLTLTPIGGYSGQISLTCSNVPQYATCSINPSTVTLGASPVPVTVTISTQQQSSMIAVPFAWIGSLGGVWLCGLTLLLALQVKHREKRRFNFALELAVAVLLIAPMLGCGGGGGAGGGGGPTPPGQQATTPKGTYTVTLVASGPGAPPNTSLTLTVN